MAHDVLGSLMVRRKTIEPSRPTVEFVSAPEDRMGILPLLIPVAAAGIKYFKTHHGKSLLSKIRKKRREILAVNPQTDETREQLEALTALENEARAGRLSEADTAALADVFGRSNWRWHKPTIDPTARMLANGTGGLQFTVTSPAGSGRLARLPFFPLNTKDALSAVFDTSTGSRLLVESGIDSAGDDPTVNLVFQEANQAAWAAGTVLSWSSARIPLVVRALEYGVYRILGLQTHEWGLWFDDNPFTVATALGTIPNRRTQLSAAPIVTLSGLQLQNGRKLFITKETQVPASTYEMLPYDQNYGGQSSGVTPVSSPGVVLKKSVWERRKSRFFAGLRDNPVVERNTVVTMYAQALAIPRPGALLTPPVAPYGPGLWLPYPNQMAVPFSANLVVEMLEDEVYGDPIVPSASARAGAQTKLNIGQPRPDREGGSEMLVTTAKYTPPWRR